LPLIQQVYAGWSLGTANFEAFRNIVNSLYPPPAAQATGEPLPLRFENSIAFKDIAFRQPGEDFSLSGVSFEIGRGEHIGISGRTGSGKSTILDLLMGLLEPGEGSILVDGKPIGPAERPAWQASLAHVPRISI
jgi:ATP-binding cassette subfamily B protein